MREQFIDFEKIDKMISEYVNSQEEKEKKNIENDIIVEAMPLVRKIASHLARRSTDPTEDILQVGILGLIKAVKMFDPAKSNNFKTYATYFITGEIRHYLRDKVSVIKAPREIYELAYRVNKVIHELREPGGTLPSEKVIATELNTPVDKIREVIDVEKRRHIVSLEQLSSAFDTDYSSFTDKIPNENYSTAQEYQENKILITSAVNKLPQDLKEIIEMNFFQDISQRKISEILGISQMQVSRKIKRALKQLFEIINKRQEI